jgi:3-deoxy-D-manno-octulosonate 8-phosphate phosphatase (KDO 8-P phosphatase)
MHPALREKAKKIRLLVLDVDGVLTSGKLFYSTENTALADFFVHDGLGMKLLEQSGVQIAIISSRLSEAVTQRMRDLGIERVFQGQREKIVPWKILQQELALDDDQIACMGDDLPDLPLLRRAGLSVTVPGAPLLIRKNVDWITKKPGGMGAVRELCELIMDARGTWQSVIDCFLRD